MYDKGNKIRKYPFTIQSAVGICKKTSDDFRLVQSTIISITLLMDNINKLTTDLFAGKRGKGIEVLILGN